MYEIRQRLSSRSTLVKVCTLPAERVCRYDRLRLEAVSAGRTAKINLTQGCHNASIWYRLTMQGIFMPDLLFEWDYIALVQHFLRAYFLASQARCALAITRDPVVDAD